MVHVEGYEFAVELEVVDILNSDPKMVKSYMCAEQMASYRKYHGLDTVVE